MLQRLLPLLLLCSLQLSFLNQGSAQAVLIDHNFQSNALPSGVTSNGTLNPTKAADGVCSKGMIQVNNGGQYLQIDLPSCGVLKANMKSTSTSVRTVAIKYKKYGDAAYTTAATNLSIGTAAAFNLTSLYPELVTNAPISVRLEPISGNIQVHDLYAESNGTLSNQAEISAFKLPGQVGPETINSAAGTISINMPVGTDVSAMTPSLVTTSYNATIAPSATTAQNFTSPVTYTVTAENGTVTKTWTVQVNFVSSSNKDITAFQLAANQIGASVINTSAGTVTLNMPSSANISAIIPLQFEISPFASVSPATTTAQDFNSPVSYTVTAQDNSTKTWTVTVNKITPNYTISTTVEGLGKVSLNPPGGTYPENTVVTLTAEPLMGSTFLGWSQGLSGTNTVATLTLTQDTAVKASFTNNHNFNFGVVKGFAAAPGSGFTGTTIGGGCATDTLFINGPAEFNKLCEGLYYRQQAYKNNTTVNGMKKAPLIILLRAGVYDGTQSLTTNGGKVFGNQMLDIPEQGDLTFLGDTNVVFKIGINVKRAFNVIIRNITFFDYYDDGINIGYPETHHIWIDHCTFGHPTTMPTDTEHPDGGCDVKDGASYVTISWCIFRNSWKTSLVGHSDNNGGTDSGRLKVTYYNNWFVGTNSRNPRVRFGEVHFLNNLTQNVGLYGIAAANSAWVYAENNFYLNTDWPMYADRTVTDFKAVYGNNSDDIYTSKTGNIPAKGLKQVGNEYDDSGLPVITAQINPAMLNPGGRSIKFDSLNTAAVFNPLSYYTYTPMTASDVRMVVPLFAGADKVKVEACASTVPLNFISLSATPANNGKSVNVNWVVNSELNTSHFQLERSLDGINYYLLGTVQALNQSGTNTYAYTDSWSNTEKTYYRVKSIDKDGSFIYSSTVLYQQAAPAQKLRLYPNPAADVVTIQLPEPSKTATIKLLTLEGKVLLINTLPAGNTTALISVVKLPAGIYLIEVDNGGARTVQKLSKR